MIAPSDFPWRAGMLDATSGDRMFNDDVILRVDGIDSGCEKLPDSARPDLTDPATLGALLGAVRVAWGCPGAHTACGTDPSTGRMAWWFTSVGGEDRLFRCDDEGTVLLAAWAARPTVPR